MVLVTPNQPRYMTAKTEEHLYKLNKLLADDKVPEDVDFLSFAEQFSRGPVARYPDITPPWTEISI